MQIYCLSEGGLISESFSLWPQSPKKCAKNYPEHYPPTLESMIDICSPWNFRKKIKNKRSPLNQNTCTPSNNRYFEKCCATLFSKDPSPWKKVQKLISLVLHLSQVQ